MICKKFYRMPEPKPPTFFQETTMKVAHKLLNAAGERWMERMYSDRRTHLVFKDGQLRAFGECMTQREFEHKVIFTYEMKVPT